VPDDKIRKRYHRALALLPGLVDVCDKILVYDNSDDPTLIFSKAFEHSEFFPNSVWQEAELKQLLGNR
jgi:predicted ABC-type ATPase